MEIVTIVIAVLIVLLVLFVCGFFSLLLLLAAFWIFSVKGRRKQAGVEKLFGWKYAHRGLHGQDKPENSMAAFQAALDGGYGVELDVHLTQDGELVVIHDHDLLRSTGREGKVEEMTLNQLQQCRLEGTEETIPTLKQVLQLFDGKVPLIIELKSIWDNYPHLTDRVMAELKDYSGVYCVESFDPRCLKVLKQKYPHVIRGQLSEDYMKTKPKFPWYLRLAMTNLWGNFLFSPDFIAYRFEDRKNLSLYLAQKLWNMPLVAWTLQSREDLEIASSEGWIPIFEGFTP